jgi:uncharacterized protein
MTRSLRSSTARDAVTPVTFGVMARAPIAGKCKTRLAKTIGDEAAAQLYAAMLADRLEAVSVLPATRRVLLAAPEDDGAAALRALAPVGWDIVEQRGLDLGARLANAVRDLLPDARGGIVCLVDSDSPTLPLAELWPQLSAKPTERSVLLGPCSDGGYYLIGMGTLETGVFDDIPWSTEGVATATRERCAHLGLVVRELPCWYDVDESRDLDRLETELRERPLLAPRTAAFFREAREARA